MMKISGTRSGTRNQMRGNSRFKWIEMEHWKSGYPLVIFASFVFLAGATWGPGLGNTVEAQTFIAQDKKGTPKARLGVNQKTETILTFLASSGKKRKAPESTQKEGPIMVAGNTTEGKMGGGILQRSALRTAEKEVRATTMEYEWDNGVGNLRKVLHRNIIPRPGF